MTLQGSLGHCHEAFAIHPGRARVRRLHRKSRRGAKWCLVPLSAAAAAPAVGGFDRLARWRRRAGPIATSGSEYR